MFSELSSASFIFFSSKLLQGPGSLVVFLYKVLWGQEFSEFFGTFVSFFQSSLGGPEFFLSVKRCKLQLTWSLKYWLFNLYFLIVCFQSFYEEWGFNKSFLVKWYFFSKPLWGPEFLVVFKAFMSTGIFNSLLCGRYYEVLVFKVFWYICIFFAQSFHKDWSFHSSFILRTFTRCRDLVIFLLKVWIRIAHSVSLGTGSSYQTTTQLFFLSTQALKNLITPKKLW